MESRGIAPVILNLGARWRRMVNLTLRPLYSSETSFGIHNAGS